MAKLNIYAQLRMPAETSREFTLTLGEEEGKIKVRRLTMAQMASVPDLGDKYVAKYVTGFGPVDKFGIIDTEHKNFVEPDPLPAVNGVFVNLGSRTAYLIATVMAAQYGSPDDRYSFEELAAFSMVDEGYEALVEIVNWVAPQEEKEGEEDESGNASAVSLEDSPSS